ncbi:MAG TPA: DUF4105 domain-containing protein [Gemmatimonadaceae bacterium]|nr:DUF4105 domain-containing protein [Gemmatimonadaceae bacterium]
MNHPKQTPFRRAVAPRYLLAALVVAVVLAAALVGSLEPRANRDWIPQQAVLPVARFYGRHVDVSRVRNFKFTAPERFTVSYEDRTYDLDKLNGVWFVLTPFYDTWRGPAHSFVTFGFADSQFVSISVEARRERGEEYGPVKGVFNRYELIYVIGDERDVIGQRAILGDYPVYLYPIRAPREKMRAMFVDMLQRANALREQPEFYNTITNNCTSNVIDHVNSVASRPVPGGLKTMLPGYSDEVAMRLGLIDSDLDLSTTRRRFRVNDRARRFAHDPYFSLRIREPETTSGS